ncbi:MAG: TIGR02301 family protein [Hyphococcus sp.]
MMFRTLIAALAVVAPALPAGAQETDGFAEYEQRQSDLVALSALFGELHLIRRQCDPRREGDVWRERMKTLVDLEDPQPQARDDMIAAFNKGYRAAQQRFRNCSGLARDHAAARAAQGEMIVERLAAPLEETILDDEIEPALLVVSPTEN